MTLMNRRSFKYGIPFLLAIVGGSFGLKEFAQLRYTFSKKSTVKEDIKRSGMEVKDQKESSIEKQYEKLKDMDLDNWEQVRGPRPWEEKASA